MSELIDRRHINVPAPEGAKERQHCQEETPEKHLAASGRVRPTQFRQRALHEREAPVLKGMGFSYPGAYVKVVEMKR